MKIAVYTIALNEEKFVTRWAESAAAADYRVILDTGSSDSTVAFAEAHGVRVGVQRFDPWRFDVARNAALDLVPSDADLCIALDMDEVLQPGWRQELEALPLDVTRPRYKYTWSWVNGQPGLQYSGDKIHSRSGYVWRHPVHEVLKPLGEERQAWCGLEIHHHPDSSKSRGQYFPLLELAVAEDPNDDRNSHYLAREYFFQGMLAEAEAEFKRHLSLPSAVWGAERSQSCRYLYKITGDVKWLYQATTEAPGRREPWVDLAQHFYNEGAWAECLEAAMAALRIQERPLEYLTEAFAWGDLPHDLAAISSYRMGYFYEAKHHGMEALKLSPYDARLEGNYRFYAEAAA